MPAAARKRQTPRPSVRARPTLDEVSAQIKAQAATQHGVITGSQLAELLAVVPRTIQKRAVMLNAVNAGRVFLLTPAEAMQIAAELDAPDKRGRPLSRNNV